MNSDRIMGQARSQEQIEQARAARRLARHTGKNRQGTVRRPAQAHARFLERQEREKTLASQFEHSLPFEVDDFQDKALRGLEEGDNVLVAAPTGAGKTVIADFAVFLAQHRNMKAFYTTPIKALSNQKYHDLVKIYGKQNVGLLTGDISINSEANIVVMTTEVLRNMLYERSVTLDALRYVVLDEIHYLGDQFRGQVWEEVIIHLPRRVKIVGLSATVSNIEDFGAWIESVRGKTRLIVSEHRPVPLEQSVIVQASPTQEPEIYDLEGDGEGPANVNPELLQRLRELNHRAAVRQSALRKAEDGGRGRHRSGRRARRPGIPDRPVRRYYPSRADVVDELDVRGLLPAIYFIFARKGCERAVEECINAGLTLTTEQEALLIRRIADTMVAGTLGTQDLKALHYSSFRFALEHGFAAHHAGMVALFREIVEACFEQGLIKVVFATETLALGINMPARSVVIEKLDKFNGVSRVPLTPGQYTQLTGRAGRRGIDTLGHAVVVDQDGLDPAALAALSSRRVYPLHSSFSPSFNMAVNLLSHLDYDSSRRTLDKSFAQWEANEDSSQIEEQIDDVQAEIKGYETNLDCRYGNIHEFLLLRQHLTDLQRGERRKLRHTQFRTPQERRKAFQRLDDEISRTRRAEREHPCNDCPNLQRHLRWGRHWLTAHRQLDRLQDQYRSRTGLVSRRFELICSVLLDLGYLKGDHPAEYRLTAKGQILRRLYTEKDLLLAQCLEEHVFDGCDAQQLASLVSAFIYEPRYAEAGRFPSHFPGGKKGAIAVRVRQMEDIWDSLDYTVEQAGLDPLDQLSYGITGAIYDWSADKPLLSVLRDIDIQPGDFVRTCKRLCDVLGQIRDASAQQAADDPHSPDAASWDLLSQTADEAYSIVNRGVVSYSGTDSDQSQEDGHPEVDRFADADDADDSDAADDGMNRLRQSRHGDVSRKRTRDDTSHATRGRHDSDDDSDWRQF